MEPQQAKDGQLFPTHFRTCKEALMITQVLAESNSTRLGLIINMGDLQANYFELTLGIRRFYLEP